MAKEVKADYALFLSAWSILTTFIGITTGNYAIKRL
jgi:hypothetical protein